MIRPYIASGAVTALDKSCYFCTKPYLVGTYWHCLSEMIPMSTHKIYYGAKAIFQFLLANFLTTSME